MVSHPENGSDSPIGSNRDRGRDRRSPGLLVLKGSRAPVIRAMNKLGLPDGHDKYYVSTTSSPDI